MSSIAASLPAEPMTAEQLLELPDDGMRHELVRGALRTMPPAGYRHGRVASRVGAKVEAFVSEHKLGDVLASETGFTLARGPDTVRAPDAAFVRAERVPAPEDQRGFAELAPDLVVEVVSPYDRLGELTAKALDWLDAGARLVWIIDPDERLAIVHRPDGLASVLREDGELDGEDVLPGFRLALSTLFD